MSQTPAQQFTDHVVWQKAHAFVLKVYGLTKAFPRDEQYGLTSQFRRAAVTVPANVAEGFCKRSLIDKVRFFNITKGSLAECHYYVILAQDLGYIQQADELLIQVDEISRPLNAYARTLRRKTPNS